MATVGKLEKDLIKAFAKDSACMKNVLTDTAAAIFKSTGRHSEAPQHVDTTAKSEIIKLTVQLIQKVAEIHPSLTVEILSALESSPVNQDVASKLRQELSSASPLHNQRDADPKQKGKNGRNSNKSKTTEVKRMPETDEPEGIICIKCGTLKSPAERKAVEKITQVEFTSNDFLCESCHNLDREEFKKQVSIIEEEELNTRFSQDARVNPRQATRRSLLSSCFKQQSTEERQFENQAKHARKWDKLS